MIINFNKITIHNFLSIGHMVVSLDDRGVTLVEGYNENQIDSAVSNGSGKSSIFNAISWVLTGETVQGISSNIVNIFGKDGCFVELEMTINNDNYVITRFKDYGKISSDLKIIVNGVDKSGKGIRESTKILEKYLGELSSDLIGSIIILGQGLPHKFTSNTPSGRKELLEKLSKSDFMVEDIKTRLNSRKDELSTRMRQFQDDILEEKAKLSIYDNYIVDSQNKLNELKDLDFSGIETLEDLIATDKETESTMQVELLNYDETIEQLTSTLSTVSNKKDSKLNVLISDKDKKLNPLIDEKNNLLKQQSDLYFKLDHADDDICPTCGQIIPNKEHIDKQPLLDSIKTLEKDIAAIMVSIDDINKSFEEQRLYIISEYDVNTIISNINTVRNNKKDLQDRLSKLTNVINKRNIELTNMKAEQDSYEKNVKQLQDTINLNLQRKQDCDNKIVYYNEEVNNLSQHLDVINQMLTIIKRDFRGYLLSNVINFINLKANEYSKIVFGNDNIKFELDGNNINISYANKVYENLSGGEKQKLDIIIQLAIKDMLSMYLNVYCNVLVLDEIFDNLDTLGCQKILELISALDNIKSIYIISHHADELKIPYDSKIIIKKDNTGISRIIQ